MKRVAASRRITPLRLRNFVLRKAKGPINWARYGLNRLAVTPCVPPTEPQPDCGSFTNITVVSQANAYRSHLPGAENALNSGPVFREVTPEPWMRHCMADHVADVLPVLPAIANSRIERIERPCVWLGYMQMHFGHLIAEHLTRALWSRVQRPDDLYLFVMPPGTPVPYLLRDLFAWYGLPPDQLRQVTTPVVAAELRIYPQGELFLGQGPSGQYLDLLDRHAAAASLRPRPADTVFVTRFGMLKHSTGSHAAEGFIVSLLRQRGVTVLDPATAPIREQLAICAGAQRLIYSEGSALHGRQLLGRIDQDIVVLNRRPGSRMAENVITPRCRSLRYVEATAAIAMPTHPEWGGLEWNLGLSVYDAAVLRHFFNSIGLDIDPIWDEATYRVALYADAETWVTRLDGAGRGYDRATLEALARNAIASALTGS